MRLVPMNEADYQQFITQATQEYAQGQARSGTWRREEAAQLARQAITNLLPAGLLSQDQSLYMIENDNAEKVGTIWLGFREEGGSRIAVLYDFLIFEPYRRQGYGAQALELMEQKVREAGAERGILHVFWHNTPARSLYLKAGYAERNVTMVKQLNAGSSKT